MAELKTKMTEASVQDFLDAIPDAIMRQDCLHLVTLMQDATQAEGKIWGDNIIGFGSHPYTYPNGKSIGWMVLAFAPRKGKIALYLTGAIKKTPELLEQLGKHSKAKSCMYIKRLSDVNENILKELLRTTVERVTQN